MSYGRVIWMTVFAIGLSLPLEAAIATWDRNPEPAVVAYRLSYGTQSGVHPTSISVGDVTSYQFFPPPGQRIYIVVQAVDASGALSAKSAEVTYDVPGVAVQNQAPSLTQPANQSTPRNTAASLTLFGSDPEGATLTYGASGLPPGLSINTATGVISGTATTAGPYTVTASASDLSQTTSRTFTWTVTNTAGTNTVVLSPTDTSITINSTNYSTDQKLYTYTYPANRVAGAIVMKFDLSQLPANATIQSATLQLSLLETDGNTADSTYNVSLHQILNRNPDVTRATGMTADGVNNWTANTCCDSNIPLAQSDVSPARSVTAVTRALGAKTWDALSLVQAWRSTPSANYGLLLNSDGTKGTNRYRFFASMEHLTASQRPSLTIMYTVSGTPGDTTPPTVSMGAPTNNATVAGSSVAVSATASDGVGVVGVQFRLDGVNLGAEDTSYPYSLVWNTTGVSNGAHVLTAVARDAAGNSTTSTSRTVTVSNAQPNRAPTLTQPPNQTSAEGNAVSLTLAGSDPDGNALAYSATGLPNGVAINATSGLISGTPSYTSAAVHSVTATVSDGPLSASRTFSWTITNTNRPPVLTQPANQTSMPSTNVSLQLSASDPDGTAVSYQATGLPAGASINASTGLISGQLTAGSAGVYTVTATASDGPLTSTQTFAWSVGDTDMPVRGDFDGDGKADPATYRSATGQWRLWPSANNFTAASPIVWGTGSDVPVPADYDGDRKTDIAVYRPSTGTWHVLLSSTNMQSNLELEWGDSTDRPMPLDYDNDGKADLALPRFGGFEILLSRSNYTTSVIVR